MSDSHVKSIAKSISWRFVATLTTFFLVFIFTRKMTLALSVSALELFLTLVIYYAHERVWARINFFDTVYFTFSPPALAAPMLVEEEDV